MRTIKQILREDFGLECRPGGQRRHRVYDPVNGEFFGHYTAHEICDELFHAPHQEKLENLLDNTNPRGYN